MENKIPFYNIVNMLLTGLIFIGVLVSFNFLVIIDFYKAYEIGQINVAFSSIIIFSFFAIIYEIGLIINRLGSLLENILIYIKLIPFDDDYKKFNDRKKDYPILTTLSREYALSRTSIVLFILIGIITTIKFTCWSTIPFLISVIFFFSLRKYSQKIIKLMK